MGEGGRRIQMQNYRQCKLQAETKHKDYAILRRATLCQEDTEKEEEEKRVDDAYADLLI